MRDRLRKLPRTVYLEVAFYSLVTFWAALYMLRAMGYIR